MFGPLDAEWPSQQYLVRKFRDHGAEVGARTIQEYDDSTRETIEHGVRFECDDREEGGPRVGYWDVYTGLFTSLSPNETRIINHFRPDDPDYAAKLPNSTYRS